jgi:hypothetical protein
MNLECCPNCGEVEDLVLSEEYDGGGFEADDTVCLGCDRVFGPDGEWRGGVNSEVAKELHSTFMDALSGAVALDPTEEMDEETSVSTMEFFAYAHGDTMIREDRLKDVLEYWLLHYYHTQEGMNVFDVEYTTIGSEVVVKTREREIEIDNPQERVVEYASKVLYGTDSGLDDDIEKAREKYELPAEPGEMV